MSPSAKSAAGQKFSFRARLENWEKGMDYCAVAVPARITKALGTKSAVLVMAQINKSVPFKVSLFPVGGGEHYLRIKSKVRKEVGVEEGDLISIQVTTLDRAVIVIPADFKKALKAESATADFDAMTPGKKNFAIRRIEEALKPETRAKRIQEIIEEARRESEKRAERKA